MSPWIGRVIGTVVFVATAISSIACVPSDRSDSQLDRETDAQQCLVEELGLSPAAQVADLAGVFDLELHVTTGRERDSVIRGRMTLTTRPDSIRGEEREGSPFVIYGWTTISSERIGDVVMTTPLSSTDPTQPGVLGLVDRRDSAIVLILGSAAEEGNFSLHTGLDFQVLRSGPGGFRGTWEVESLRRKRPAGVFCARRVQEGN